MFSLSQRSLDRLQGVHPDLVRVVNHAITITDVDFGVLEGLRTLDRQKLLMAQGATRTMNSRHLYGCAVDLGAFVDGCLVWTPALYQKVWDSVRIAAGDENVPVTWGGSWLQFKDLDHFELPEKIYPNNWRTT